MRTAVRLIVNPVSTVVLTIALAVLIPTAMNQQQPVIVVSPGIAVGATARWSDGGPEPTLFALRDGDQIEFIVPDRSSWDLLSSRLASTPESVVPLRLTVTRQLIGRPFFMREEQTSSVIVGWSGGANISAIPAPEAHRIRMAAASWLERMEGPTKSDIAEVLRAGVVTENRTLWGGVALTIALVTSLGLWCASFGWVPDALEMWRSRRRARSLAAGRCPRCAYDMSNSPMARCPECGEWMRPG